MNQLSRLQLSIVAAIMLIVGALIGVKAMEAERAPEAAVAAAAPVVREAVTMPTTFAPVVKAVVPAVVNISSSRVVRTSDQGDSFEDLFHGFRMPRGFQMPDRPQRQKGQDQALS